MAQFVDHSSGLKAKDDSHDQVIDGLYSFYSKTMLPIEQAISYHMFHSSFITEGEMRAAPIVLVVGPYSVGKTSFIRYLVGRDFPGQNIGPEPTTDRYHALMHGPEDRIVPGNTVTVAPLSPFAGCQAFGNGFLTRFEGAVMDCDLLRKLTLVDTPGVLSGSKHRDRSYDPDIVLSWFAERADMIILIVDVNKLDLSDEMAGIIRMLQKNSEKVRVALNKCDSVSQQQLMKVYGAIMWNLAKVLGTPEVCRIYCGSFWEIPPANQETANLLLCEMRDMMRDLGMLPRDSAVRKVNEVVKRKRKVKLLACLLDYLRMEMPKVMGTDKKKEKLLGDMEGVRQTVCKKYDLSPGDFPDIDTFVEVARNMDFKEFPALKGKRLHNGKLLDQLDSGVSTLIPNLLQLLPATGSQGLASTPLPTTADAPSDLPSGPAAAPPLDQSGSAHG